MAGGMSVSAALVAEALGDEPLLTTVGKLKHNFRCVGRAVQVDPGAGGPCSGWGTESSRHEEQRMGVQDSENKACLCLFLSEVRAVCEFCLSLAD